MVQPHGWPTEKLVQAINIMAACAKVSAPNLDKIEKFPVVRMCIPGTALCDRLLKIYSVFILSDSQLLRYIVVLSC